MFPQWPLVVTATMFQFPTNPPAIAGEAEEMIAKAVERAKARIQLPIMESSCVKCGNGAMRRADARRRRTTNVTAPILCL